MLENIIDQKYMKEAIKEAKKAKKKREVPVGVVIVKDGEIIARGHNQKETKNNTLLHAENIAIAKASKKLNTWRLTDCIMYVTLEPCIMCAGAIQHSRIKRLVYAATDPKTGAIESIMEINEVKSNHKIDITKGVLKEESSHLIKEFFREIRNEKKKRRN